jgi:hypothetical protein
MIPTLEQDIELYIKYKVEFIWEAEYPKDFTKQEQEEYTDFYISLEQNLIQNKRYSFAKELWLSEIPIQEKERIERLENYIKNYKRK